MPLTPGEIIGVLILCTILIYILLLLALKIYAKLTCGFCTSKASLKGKTVIITGGSKGLGLETSRDLAMRGARLIIACRDTEAGHRVKDKIANESDNNFILVKKLDLSSQESIRAFAAEINQTEDRLDVLIHNAAIVGSHQKEISENGLDKTMATNYFGPFLLTHLLIDLLKRSKPSRVVVVGSGLYWLVPFNLNHLKRTGNWPGYYTYFYSKYALMVFALELARRLEGQGVTVNTLHPGAHLTGIFKNLPMWSLWYIHTIKWLFKSGKECAQTTIHCAVCEKVEGVTGKYFFDCKERELTSKIRNLETAHKLWEVTQSIVMQQSDPVINPQPLTSISTIA